MSDDSTPLIVQYLYVHQPGEDFYYPSVRTSSSIAAVAERYLECALTQVASLRLGDVACELALATNVDDRSVLGRAGRALLERIEALGVEIIPTAYVHRPADNGANYVSSRYVLDAILSAGAAQPPDRQLWLTDLDCVWADAGRVFAATPPAPEVGCVFIGYAPDEQSGISDEGGTRRSLGELAETMGAPQQEMPSWVGGELLTGTCESLRHLVEACERIDAQLAERKKALAAEEEILSLVGALGLVRFRNLGDVAARIGTGPRNVAWRPDDPSAFGLWHLPSEKGLSLRRAARQVLAGREASLRRDLADSGRLARRFNVLGTGLGRRLRDDGWIAAQRLRDTGRSFASRKSGVR